MATINKITTLRSPSNLTEEQIQAHIDELNNQGYYLICVDNMVGWYRFFWAKQVE